MKRRDFTELRKNILIYGEVVAKLNVHLNAEIIINALNALIIIMHKYSPRYSVRFNLVNKLLNFLLASSRRYNTSSWSYVLGNAISITSDRMEY